jgi:hypothetical protein
VKDQLTGVQKTKPCSYDVTSDLPENQPCYPRASALLQEEEIKKLYACQARSNVEIARLSRSLAQTSKLLRKFKKMAEVLLQSKFSYAQSNNFAETIYTDCVHTLNEICMPRKEQESQ